MFDIAVLGAGFAGSLTALILQRIGLKTALIDRASHPRFAIGESSTPIANMILRDLSAKYDLPRISPLALYGTWRETYPEVTCGRKRGFSYFQHEPGQAFTPTADHTNELLVTASHDNVRCDTHWLRADVDAFLADEAKNTGVEYHDKTDITAAERDGQVWRLQGNQDSSDLRLEAKFLIDATGGASLLPRLLGISSRVDSMRTRSRAIYSHFEGVPSWTDRLAALNANVGDHPFNCDDSAQHHLLDNGWMWMLRFDSNRTSVGIALDLNHEESDNDSKQDGVTQWSAILERYPTLRDLLSPSQIASPPGCIIASGRMQRRVARAAGDGWALLPHTVGFVDPLHSTGIGHSLCGVERLTNLIQHSWDDSETFPDSLASCEAAIFRELDLIDQLVAGCYASLSTSDLSAEADQQHSLRNFRVFTAYSMLYFAAATTYESTRSDGEPTNDFLCANDADFCQIVSRVYDRAKRLSSLANLSDQQAADFETFVRDEIEPYNIAGLCDPTVNNMYRYTAADV